VIDKRIVFFVVPAEHTHLSFIKILPPVGHEEAAGAMLVMLGVLLGAMLGVMLGVLLGAMLGVMLGVLLGAMLGVMLDVGVRCSINFTVNIFFIYINYIFYITKET
jgi:hypothetical protein